MNLAGIEKIENLVKSSPILSFQERAEWLALLGLMNDKQLGELEKILSEGIRKQELGIRSQIPSQEHLNQANSRVPQMPKLSHIVNLPKIGESEYRRIRESENPALSKRPAKTAASLEMEQKKTLDFAPKVKSGGGFLGKLKSIFAEKELTTSRQEFPLELTDGSRQEVRGKGQEVSQATVHLPLRVNDKLKNAPPVPPKPKVSFPIPAAHAVAIRAALSEAERAVHSVGKDPKSASIQEKTNKPVLKAPAPLAVKLNSPDRAADIFTPGINFPKTSEKSKSQTLANIKEHLEQRAESVPLLSSSTRPSLGKDVVFKTLEDLNSFDYRLLDNGNSDELAKKIKSLINEFGYFQVIFNLEKSPVYKIYLATGLKLLSEQLTFEELAEQPRSEPYLERQEFEKFTDLLTKMQTG